MLTLALSKGRILDDTLPLLARAGIEAKEDPRTTRKLILDTHCDDLRLLILRAQDVPTFVEYGGADLGIAGKDVLLEHRGLGLYEPLDLGIARCKLMVARPHNAPADTSHPRVATKYAETARRYFAAQGRQVEIIHLYGSMEIAPQLGLADFIVDLVQSGKTLEANGLVAGETIADISARLIVNKAAMKMRHQRIKGIIASLSDAIAPSP